MEKNSVKLFASVALIKLNLLAAGILLAALTAGYGQPVIINQPQNLTNLVGTTATFTVGATGTQPLAYQWQKSVVDLATQTNATLVLTSVQTSDEADYRVAVTNVDGAINSAPAHLYVMTPPRITKVTNYNMSVSLGAPVKMQVWATGTAPLSYQWWFGSLALAGKTAAILNLTNVQTTDDGLYTVVVSNWAGSASTNVSLDVDPTFTRITSDPIVTDQGYKNMAASWADLDDDGDLDLFLVTDRAGYNPTYRNNGDGTFTRTFEASLQAIQAPSWAYSWGDYDNDGYLDLFVPQGMRSPLKNLLYHNNRNGAFTQITNSPVVTEGGVCSFGTWGDYDRDGDLDLFVTHGTAGLVLSKNSFYQNQGDGTFLKLTNNLVQPLINEVQYWNLPVWVDIDNDGWQDLFIANIPSSRNYLFRNTATNGFIKVTGDPLVSEFYHWGDAGWADYDNDGDLDVFLTAAYGSGTWLVALYRNDGSGHFTKMTTKDVGALVSERVNSFQCAWGDYDNDGWLDLYIANGWHEGDARADLLYRNNGDGTFTKATTGSPANEKGAALGGYLVDINHDGFLDLFTVTSSAAPDNSLSRLYRNNGNSNSWLCVKCVGTVSPRWGTGTKVRVKVTIRGKSVWQLRVIDPGGWSNAQNFIAHFGLGDATNLDVLRIEWTSGIVQELTNVPVKQYLTVTEPARLQMAQPGQLQIQCWKDMSYSIECSSNLATWTPMATVTNLTGSLQWPDPDAPGSSARFYRVLKQ